MKKMNVAGEFIIYTMMGMLFGCVFFRQIIFSHFDLLLGGIGDSRFNGVILEHWWQVLQGTASWLSPAFFFPVQGVLGYSDAGFLNALPYVILRSAAIDPFTSYQIVLFSLVAMGWIATIVFFRCCLKISILPAILGAVLFVFPNSMAVLNSHTQLLTVYFVPCLAIGIYLFLRNFSKVTFTGTIAGIFVAVIIPAIFYTSFYIGWFVVLFVLLFSTIICVLRSSRSCSSAILKNIIPEQRPWLKILPYAGLSAICFIPIFRTYVPIMREFGGRSYQEVSSMLPSYIDYVNVGPDNWLWGRILYSAFPELVSRPMSWELTKGLPICSLFVFLALLVYFIHKTKHHYLAAPQTGSCKIVVDGNRANDGDGNLAMLAAGMGIAVLLVWLLMLKIGGMSLWWLIFKLIPGAGSIRAVYRFQHVLAFPIALVAAIGVHQLINWAKGLALSHVKRNVMLVASAVVCLLLIAEQFNIGSLADYSKQQQHNMLARIGKPPPQAKVFALLPAEDSGKPYYEAQIDSMVIAQKYGLHTINGYSGLVPAGWGGMLFFSEPEYTASLYCWIKRYNLENIQLYLLDAKTGDWSSAKELQPALQKRVAPMSGPLKEGDFALKLSAEDIPARWLQNELKQCALRVKNCGKVVLSGNSGDFINPGKYAIRLAYRWVKVDSIVQSLSGFDNRVDLPVVNQNAEIKMNMKIKAPAQSGKYWLEIEAVQELVSWFKDKGFPGIRIEVDVKKMVEAP